VSQESNRIENEMIQRNYTFKIANSKTIRSRIFNWGSHAELYRKCDLSRLSGRGRKQN